MIFIVVINSHKKNWKAINKKQKLLTIIAKAKIVNC